MLKLRLFQKISFIPDLTVEDIFCFVEITQIRHIIKEAEKTFLIKDKQKEPTADVCLYMPVIVLLTNSICFGTMTNNTILDT
ncbi:hypothetical protein Lgra_2464 [Legionella gratiana]|uniref:Uncharacterized protein n=1 Tax=Legionella gratiana TaxID=45066 RepID=A0A378JES0_9GAMM|nr:hypothetical protein Lgra_2464 [Legionella gratiana]STX45518.1 Uncharacterised protein [Legionella gratiana]